MQDASQGTLEKAPPPAPAPRSRCTAPPAAWGPPAAPPPRPPAPPASRCPPARPRLQGMGERGGVRAWVRPPQRMLNACLVQATPAAAVEGGAGTGSSRPALPSTAPAAVCLRHNTPAAPAPARPSRPLQACPPSPPSAASASARRCCRPAMRALPSSRSSSPASPHDLAWGVGGGLQPRMMRARARGRRRIAFEQPAQPCAAGWGHITLSAHAAAHPPAIATRAPGAAAAPRGPHLQHRRLVGLLALRQAHRLLAGAAGAVRQQLVDLRGGTRKGGGEERGRVCRCGWHGGVPGEGGRRPPGPLPAQPPSHPSPQPPPALLCRLCPRLCAPAACLHCVAPLPQGAPARPWSTRGGRCRSGPAPRRGPPVGRGGGRGWGRKEGWCGRKEGWWAARGQRAEWQRKGDALIACHEGKACCSTGRQRQHPAPPPAAPNPNTPPRLLQPQTPAPRPPHPPTWLPESGPTAAPAAAPSRPPARTR